MMDIKYHPGVIVDICTNTSRCSSDTMFTRIRPTEETARYRKDKDEIKLNKVS